MKYAHCFASYTTQGERSIAIKLVREILATGGTISVNDGEEWTVKKSKSVQQVLDALASTGEDVIRWRDVNGETVGSFYLIWGNEEDGSCLISDHTDNDQCAAITAKMSA